MTLSYIYVITGRSKLAEFELGRLVNAGFEAPQMYTTLAYAAWSQRQFQKAVDYYEKALDMDKNNSTALNGLGYILAESDLDIPRGLRLCRKAVDIKPQSAAYLDSLGWAYFKSGEANEARAWLRRALEISPHQKEIREHMKTVVGGNS
jgi:tetratricopeptide (TPR) repeat protein